MTDKVCSPLSPEQLAQMRRLFEAASQVAVPKLVEILGADLVHRIEGEGGEISVALLLRSGVMRIAVYRPGAGFKQVVELETGAPTNGLS